MQVTDKGQVTIPKELRDRLGIEPGSDVEFEAKGETLVLRKTDRGRRGRRVVDRLRGSGDSAMTTDEIMALTRGD
jgi:AbrB family looped-hinge helix DNA binding protein